MLMLHIGADRMAQAPCCKESPDWQHMLNTLQMQAESISRSVRPACLAHNTACILCDFQLLALWQSLQVTSVIAAYVKPVKTEYIRSWLT